MTGSEYRSPFRRLTARDGLISLALAAAVVIVYLPARNYDFVNFDDSHYVYDNQQVLGGLSFDNIKWAFTTTEMGSRHPLTWLTLQLDAELWGPGPRSFHVVNFLLHGLNTGLLYLVIRCLTGCIVPSAMVAILFGLHPLRVESVAWVSERKDVLCGLFWILTMWAYERYARQPSLWRMGLVTLGYILGLLSKPMIITLPFVLLLLDYWPLRRLHRVQDLRGLVLEKAHLFALSAIFAFLTVTAQQSMSAVTSMEVFGLAERFSTVVLAYCNYLGMTFYPSELAIFYPLAPETHAIWQSIVGLAMLIGLTWGAFRLRDRHPYLIVGWLWFLGTLVPVIGLVHVGSQAYADRYTYLPHIGLFIAIVWGVWKAVAAFKIPRPAVGVVAVAVVVVFCVATREQMTTWENSQKLWERAIAVTSNNETAWRNLGGHFSNTKRHEEAVKCFEECCRIRPDLFDYSAKLAIELYFLDRYDDAERQCRHALSLKKLLQQETLKQFWNVMGDLSLRQGKWADAERYYASSIEISNTWWLPHFNRANALLQMGKVDQAIDHMSGALLIAPDKPKTSIYVNLGMMYLQRGDFDRAVGYLTLGVNRDPGNVNYRKELGVALMASGRTHEAREHAREACRLDPAWAFRLDQQARVFAAHADPARRNPALAFRMSYLARVGLDQVPAEMIDTYAIAAAATGNFDLANLEGGHALRVAEGEKRIDLVPALAERVRLYRERRPYVLPK